MKKLFNILVLGLGLASFNSCSDEFLDTTKIGEQAEDSFYSTDTDLIKASNALYSPLWEYHYNWGRHTHGNSSTDDGLDREDLGYHEFTYNSTHFLLTYNWRYNYRGILIANKLIENVEGVEISGVDTDLQKRVVAEAKFARAYYHYDLVKKFGEVPVVDHPLLVDEFDLPRSKVSEVLAFIENDLIEAKADLPVKSALGGEYGRATKGAALALLVKASIMQASPGYSDLEFYNKGKYSDAMDYAEELFGLGEYSLATGNYHDIFTEDGENGSGSIFEVQFYDSPKDDGAFTNNGNFATFLNMPWFGGGAPYGRYQSTYDLYLAFEDGDPRREASVINMAKYADIWLLDGEEVTEVAQNLTNFYNFKHYMSKERFMDLGNFTNSPINERIFRLSDIYLNYAEAALETGDAATALQYVNMVRERARGEGAIPADLTSVTIDDIYQERRVELCNEGHRWHDLARTGRLEQELKVDGYLQKADVVRDVDGGYIISENGDAVFKANNIVESKHRFYPIPQSEVDNAGLTQMYGW
ncbi:RagB/SusD family nutrient uptake outer membrane protein [Sediminitomix flava]|uniref:Putative outer membrane starch-binding protein n=1 Tax=Sediminitomix flava TaxID=379075 RepID=A0A315Z9R1_SEDFL|nr:RagB/SusD family nutrient uptake outer membrane protein [Sediminitomix flava]PWJ40800.1 putative outer membrane starch-binding protein [Sediminitomix flava]